MLSPPPGSSAPSPRGAAPPRRGGGRPDHSCGTSLACSTERTLTRWGPWRSSMSAWSTSTKQARRRCSDFPIHRHGGIRSSMADEPSPISKKAICPSFSPREAGLPPCRNRSDRDVAPVPRVHEPRKMPDLRRCDHDILGGDASGQRLRREDDIRVEGRGGSGRRTRVSSAQKVAASRIASVVRAT